MGEKGEDNAQIFNEQRQRQREEAAAEEDRKRKIALEQSRVPKFKREEPAAASSPVKPSSQPYLARKNKGVIKTVHNEALPKTLAAPTKVTVEEISVVKYKRCVNNKFELMTECTPAAIARCKHSPYDAKTWRGGCRGLAERRWQIISELRWAFWSDLHKRRLFVRTSLLRTPATH